ncbi:hypothetical protein ACSSS7_002493 [Eimeria intestinalis]
MLQNLKKNLFGVDAAVTLSDAVKEQRRSIARSLRSLERQQAKAEGEERRVFAELKAQALAGVTSVAAFRQSCDGLIHPYPAALLLLMLRCYRCAAAARAAAARAAAPADSPICTNTTNSLSFRSRVDKLQTKQLLVVQQQQATQELHRHFQGCAKLLSLANKTVDLPSIQVAVKGFNRESQKLGLMVCFPLPIEKQHLISWPSATSHLATR